MLHCILVRDRPGQPEHPAFDLTLGRQPARMSPLSLVAGSTSVVEKGCELLGEALAASPPKKSLVEMLAATGNVSELAIATFASSQFQLPYSRWRDMGSHEEHPNHCHNFRKSQSLAADMTAACASAHTTVS